MTHRPIDEAKNADLRGSFQALQRAAQRARELAVKTGTAIVVSRDGKLEYLLQDALPADALQVQQPVAPYRDKR